VPQIRQKERSWERERTKEKETREKEYVRVFIKNHPHQEEQDIRDWRLLHAVENN